MRDELPHMSFGGRGRMWHRNGFAELSLAIGDNFIVK